MVVHSSISLNNPISAPGGSSEIDLIIMELNSTIIFFMIFIYIYLYITLSYNSFVFIAGRSA